MRKEFPVSVRKAAFKRCGGICECGCGRPVGNPQDTRSRAEYDHVIEDMLDGGNSLENCLCLRFDCHKAKSKERAPVLAKVRRAENKRKGVTRSKQKIPYRKFDGTIVWPD